MPIWRSQLSLPQQQVRAMTVLKDLRNPRTAILEDLVQAMNTWKQLGDHVILGMDANEDVRRSETDEILGQAGLREIILELHNDQSPPATHNRNNKREPIDGFWATRGITITKGGYLVAFGEECPSDHHALWFEASYSVALVKDQPKWPYYNPNDSSLRTQD
jgi:hypothetical protein